MPPEGGRLRPCLPELRAEPWRGVAAFCLRLFYFSRGRASGPCRLHACRIMLGGLVWWEMEFRCCGIGVVVGRSRFCGWRGFIIVLVSSHVFNFLLYYQKLKHLPNALFHLNWSPMNLMCWSKHKCYFCLYTWRSRESISQHSCFDE
jgi:hypothetical protein